ARAELAEDAAAPRLLQPGPVRDHAVEDRALVVLDVQVVDALAPVAQALDRVAAPEREVPGVEEEADVGELEHALDLPRRLDVRRGVVVEGGLVAAAASGVGGAGDPVGEPLPARVVEADAALGRR